ncbi:MAG TPA: hypothetical protein VGH10_08350 [Actinomycetota bacterium]|jgi:hypothetical protein
MRTVRFAVVIATLVGCMVGPSLAASASSPPFMAGRGSQFGPGTHSRFVILAVGSGPAATGSFAAAVTGGWFVARVTCLQVDGNDGIATGVVVSTSSPDTRVGEYIVVEGVENGSASFAVPDLLRFSFQDNGGVIPSGTKGCGLPVYGPVPIKAKIRVSDGH